MKMMRLDHQIRAHKEKEKATSSGGDSAPKITIGSLAGFAAKTPLQSQLMKLQCLLPAR